MFLGGIVPTANAWIGRLFPAEKRGMVYGLSFSASFGGMFIGPLFGGFLAARLGFGSVFLVTAAADAGCPLLDDLFRTVPEQGARLAGCVVAGR